MKRPTYAVITTGLICALCTGAPPKHGPIEQPSPIQPVPMTLAPTGQTLPKDHGPVEYGTMHFQTNLGSFKSLDGEGKLDMDFKGTVLISGFKGSGEPKFTGNVSLQFPTNGAPGHNRLVYFGSGHMTIEGSWKGIQWFGTNLKGVWHGHGIIRLVGEFDKDLNTGSYYYEDDPKSIRYWQTSVIPIWLPEPKTQTVEPRERKVDPSQSSN